MSGITIDENRCKGCGLCTVACPFKLIHLGEQHNLLGYTYVTVPDQSQCTACALCANTCPDLAIMVFK